MADVVYVLLALALFATSAYYVGGCERIIGSEDAAAAPTDTEARR